MGFVPFRYNLFDFGPGKDIAKRDKPTCKMRRWLGRCAAKGILLRGVAYGLPLRGHFHWQRWLWGLEAMEMAAQAGIKGCRLFLCIVINLF